MLELPDCNRKSQTPEYIYVLKSDSFGREEFKSKHSYSKKNNYPKINKCKKMVVRTLP